MITLIRIIRIVLALLMIELTVIAVNYFIPGDTKGLVADMFDPRKAIFESLLYMTDKWGWSFQVSYIVLMLICLALLVLYYLIWMLILPDKLAERKHKED